MDKWTNGNGQIREDGEKTARRRGQDGDGASRAGALKPTHHIAVLPRTCKPKYTCKPCKTTSTMTDVDHEVPAIPIASRMKGEGGRPKPHVGPTIDDYKTLWGKTVGQHSDDFWRKVGFDVTLNSLSGAERP